MPPKILLLSNESPHSGAAGAIVLLRLFAGYPADRLVVVSNQPVPPEARRLEFPYYFLPLAVDRLQRTRFWRWRIAGRVLGGAALLRLDRLDSLLAGFQPDVVVTVMQDSWYYDLAARYARCHRLPLVLLVHDDPRGFEPVWDPLRGLQTSRDRAVYTQAVRRFCISGPMAERFRLDFGVTGEVLPPPRSDTVPHQMPEACRRLRQPGRLTLGHAGGLHYGYGEQLQQMLPVLRATGTVVELFGPRPAGILAPLAAATDVLHFHGYAPTPEAAWQGILEHCDAVLLPYLNPPGPHARQYRTHFPSKLGDCLSLGVPLLVTGPDFASGLAWCRGQGDVAWCVSNPEPAELGVALEQLRDSGDRRVSLATRAQAAATAFDAAPLRELLATSLAAAATANSP
ncbi:MAG: glycosyltransferase [Opitutales bacterium]